jgi:hypothetical protein
MEEEKIKVEGKEKVSRLSTLYTLGYHRRTKMKKEEEEEEGRSGREGEHFDRRSYANQKSRFTET